MPVTAAGLRHRQVQHKTASLTTKLRFTDRGMPEIPINPKHDRALSSLNLSKKLQKKRHLDRSRAVYRVTEWRDPRISPLLLLVSPNRVKDSQFLNRF